MNKKQKQHLINREIKATQVRVVDQGLMSFSEAMSLAESQSLDLVMINDKAIPPVVKILDYEKFIYEQTKKPKQKALEMKEIKVGPNTSDNDLSYRIEHIKEFLTKGHKVKITMKFSGREMAYVDAGEALLLKMVLAVKEVGAAENLPKLEGRNMFLCIKPSKNISHQN